MRYGKHRPNEASDPNDPQGMWAMLEQHFEWMQIKNYAPRTIEVRRMHLGYFINWCADRGILRPGEVTKPIIERYQRFMYHYRKQDGEPLSFRSQHNRLTHIRAWFRWLARHNHVLYNPAADIELPRLEHRLPKHVFTQSEAEQVINQPNTTTPDGVRDRAMLETLYSTGIRRLELINLRLYDFDTDRGTIIVRQGKGRKDRMIPIGERAMAWVDRYLREVRPSLLIGDAAGDTVFLTNAGAASSLLKKPLPATYRGFIKALVKWTDVLVAVVLHHYRIAKVRKTGVNC